MMRNLITLMVLLGVVAAGLSLTFIRAVPLPRTIEVVPPVTSKLVCAPMGEPGVLFVDGAEAITELGQDSEQAAGTTLVSGQVGPAVIRGGHALMGAPTSPARTRGHSCRAPSLDQRVSSSCRALPALTWSL